MLQRQPLRQQAHALILDASGQSDDECEADGDDERRDVQNNGEIGLNEQRNAQYRKRRRNRHGKSETPVPGTETGAADSRR